MGAETVEVCGSKFHGFVRLERGSSGKFLVVLDESSEKVAKIIYNQSCVVCEARGDGCSGAESTGNDGTIRTTDGFGRVGDSRCEIPGSVYQIPGEFVQ